MRKKESIRLNMLMSSRVPTDQSTVAAWTGWFWVTSLLFSNPTAAIKIPLFFFFLILSTGSEFLGFSSSDPVTVVLDDDGTIVADDAYFLCLPPNTKFMLLHEKETWAPVRRSKCVNICGTFHQLSLTDLSSFTFCAQWTVERPGWPGTLWWFS